MDASVVQPIPRRIGRGGLISKALLASLSVPAATGATNLVIEPVAQIAAHESSSVQPSSGAPAIKQESTLVSAPATAPHIVAATDATAHGGLEELAAAAAASIKSTSSLPVVSATTAMAATSTTAAVVVPATFALPLPVSTVVVVMKCTLSERLHSYSFERIAREFAADSKMANNAAASGDIMVAVPKDPDWKQMLRDDEHSNEFIVPRGVFKVFESATGVPVHLCISSTASKKREQVQHKIPVKRSKSPNAALAYLPSSRLIIQVSPTVHLAVVVSAGRAGRATLNDVLGTLPVAKRGMSLWMSSRCETVAMAMYNTETTSTWEPIGRLVSVCADPRSKDKFNKKNVAVTAMGEGKARGAESKAHASETKTHATTANGDTDTVMTPGSHPARKPGSPTVTASPAVATGAVVLPAVVTATAATILTDNFATAVTPAVAKVDICPQQAAVNAAMLAKTTTTKTLKATPKTTPHGAKRQREHDVEEQDGLAREPPTKRRRTAAKTPKTRKPASPAVTSSAAPQGLPVDLSDMFCRLFRSTAEAHQVLLARTFRSAQALGFRSGYSAGHTDGFTAGHSVATQQHLMAQAQHQMPRATDMFGVPLAPMRPTALDSFMTSSNAVFADGQQVQQDDDLSKGVLDVSASDMDLGDPLEFGGAADGVSDPVCVFNGEQTIH